MVMVMVIVGDHWGGGKGGMEMTTVWRTMRDHVAEALTTIKPTESLRLPKREARKKRNCSDSSGNSPVKILVSRRRV
jgi:hypothetical protein